jgi:MFS family permease
VLLRNSSLRALLVAQLVSTTGTTMTFLALPWLVLETTGSATRMSVVLAVELLPVALFGVPSGAVVARLGSRRTMLVADAVRAPLIVLVPLLHWAGSLSFGLLLGIVFVLGLFSAPYFAAQRTIVPELFGDDERLVSKASALLGGATHVTLVVGPVLAGVLIAPVGAPVALVVDGVTYVVAFVAVLGFVRGGRPLPQDDDARGVLAGIRYLARDRVLGPLVLTVILIDMAAAGLTTALPLLAFDRYDENAHVAGLLFAAIGVGAVGGSIAALRLLDRFRPLRLASAGILLASLPLWALVAPLPWIGAALAVLVFGLFIPLVNAPAIGIVTTRPPAAVRAKVMTAVMTASAVGGPVGRLAIGPLAEWAGLDVTFAAVAGVMTVGAILFALSALRSDAAAPAGTAPAPA